ncbi:hypothetical protein VHEMI06677 [[Torrubiella] hemipterigena]|uniref:Uncharacterized protein n=1 Tax=[Torrubiella] hemipterigena TaxID=1531966 RepID=A0A0A1TJN9_9HYPO|nr:hypothetical protein VHEMI06677 [[Torrubiella] hemipterigena]
MKAEIPELKVTLAAAIASKEPIFLLSDEEQQEMNKLRPPPKPIVVAMMKGGNKYKPANPWFTSLWTLKESCLRPDMLFASAACNILAIQPANGNQAQEETALSEHLVSKDTFIPLIGLISTYLMFDRHCSIEDLPEQISRLYEELKRWAMSTGFMSLLELSRTDILMLGNRRQCTSNRAEAIMSAIGATKWYKTGPELKNPAIVPNGLVLGKYPPEFVREVRDIDQASFFSRYWKSFWSDDGDAFQISGWDFCTEDGQDKAGVYLAFNDIRGSLIPFHSTGHKYADAWPELSELPWVTHASLESWKVKEDGTVSIKEACVLASSQLQGIPQVLEEDVQCQVIGFHAKRLGKYRQLESSRVR